MVVIFIFMKQEIYLSLKKILDWKQSPFFCLRTTAVKYPIPRREKYPASKGAECLLAFTESFASLVSRVALLAGYTARILYILPSQ